jgi:hypothetical protein
MKLFIFLGNWLYFGAQVAVLRFKFRYSLLKCSNRLFVLNLEKYYLILVTFFLRRRQRQLRKKLEEIHKRLSSLYPFTTPLPFAVKSEVNHPRPDQ